MRELAAQAVLLARSFEEADSQGILLSREDRQEATLAGRAAGEEPEEQAQARARVILERLEESLPSLRRVASWTRVRLRWALPFVVGAVVVGLSTNALGPARSVNLLAFPLLALLVWNLFAYVFLVLAVFFGFRNRLPVSAAGGEDDATAPAARAPGAVSLVVWWTQEWTLARVRSPDPAAADLVSRALASYAAKWARCTGDLGVCRLRGLLHLAAAGVALGVITGMYARGLGLEYRAMWESTFLSASAVAVVLEVVLGPAATIVGQTLPDAAALRSMATPAGAVPAASWIHMWALTTAGVVILPRLLLAATFLARASVLGRAVAVNPLGGSFRVLLRPERGSDVHVRLLPYSHRPATRQLGTLREVIADLFGLEARVEVSPALEYGEDAALGDDENLPNCVVIVYALVQLPEREVHGRFLRQWTQRAGESQVLVVVDSSSWRERFRDGESTRQGERQRAWDRVLREVGVQPLHLDLAAPLAGDVIDRADQVLWPDSTKRSPGQMS